jgi:hypothetical protein
VKQGACRNEEGNKVDSVEQEAEVMVKLEPMVTVEAEVSVANDGSANETTHSLMLPSKLKTKKLGVKLELCCDCQKLVDILYDIYIYIYR